MADTMLDIINENDQIIGQALRSEIHANGLLHREVHVWFITPDRKIIFQKRSLSKETNPGLLTAAVGGHVELGQSYKDAALMEIAEETGLNLSANDIMHFATIPTLIQNGKIHNRSLRALFGMLFKQPIDTLKVEEGSGDGFVTMDFDALLHPSEEILQQMSPDLMVDEFNLIHEKLERLVA